MTIITPRLSSIRLAELPAPHTYLEPCHSIMIGGQPLLQSF